MAKEKTEKIITREWIIHGAKFNIGTTPVPLSEIKLIVRRGVVIKADKDNTDLVWVGTEKVDAGASEEHSGYPLDAGEAIAIEAKDLRKIYVVASSGTQKVYFIAS